jgi:hypothetical protein
MDRHMVKYVVRQRKAAAEKARANNDKSPGGTIQMYFIQLELI